MRAGTWRSVWDLESGAPKAVGRVVAILGIWLTFDIGMAIRQHRADMFMTTFVAAILSRALFFDSARLLATRPVSRSQMLAVWLAVTGAMSLTAGAIALVSSTAAAAALGMSVSDVLPVALARLGTVCLNCLMLRVVGTQIVLQRLDTPARLGMGLLHTCAFLGWAAFALPLQTQGTPFAAWLLCPLAIDLTISLVRWQRADIRIPAPKAPLYGRLRV